jgi:hypothetical protein
LERLWNGQYFIQDVDLQQDNKSQCAQGCLSNQLFGQTWAHLLNLGHLYPEDAVAQTYRSIWKYNWTPDVGPYNKAHRRERYFARGDEAGLFNCTWPLTPFLERGVRYAEEVWTGTEYQVAAGMIWEGQIDESLAICRAIHERYHPSRHNPFNEIECGDHYARAMASWGVYLALMGFEYEGPIGHLGFSPAITPENFSAAFTTAEGWGLFSQKRQSHKQADRIELRRGHLSLKSLALAIPERCSGTAHAQLAGQTLHVKTSRDGKSLMLTFEPITIKAGQTLEVVVD